MSQFQVTYGAGSWVVPYKSKPLSFSMGLAKVIAWGILAFILTGFLALVVAGLVYGALTNWSLNGGKPPMGSVYVGIVLLILADMWVIRKLRIAYAQYRRQKMQGRLS